MRRWWQRVLAAVDAFGRCQCGAPFGPSDDPCSCEVEHP